MATRKPEMMRDSLSRIKEKIAVAQQWVTYFGYEESPRAGDTFFEAEVSEAVLDFKLNLYILYHIFKDLGVEKRKLKSIATAIADDCMDIEDAFCSINACFQLGYKVAPFWELNIEDGYWLFDKDGSYGFGDDEEGDAEGEDTVEETLGRFSSVFQAMGCSKKVSHYIECSETFHRIAAQSDYYQEEVNSNFFFVRSELLKYYLKFENSLSGIGKRSFHSRKLVKELTKCLDTSLADLHPCTRYSDREDVGEGFYLFATGDWDYQMDNALSQLCANYMAGLNANIIDLYIFALDEEYHFLPKKYAGRSNEIFPDFVSKRVKKKKTA